MYVVTFYSSSLAHFFCSSEWIWPLILLAQLILVNIVTSRAACLVNPSFCWARVHLGPMFMPSTRRGRLIARCSPLNVTGIQHLLAGVNDLAHKFGVTFYASISSFGAAHCPPPTARPRVMQPLARACVRGHRSAEPSLAWTRQCAQAIDCSAWGHDPCLERAGWHPNQTCPCTIVSWLDRRSLLCCMCGCPLLEKKPSSLEKMLPMWLFNISFLMFQRFVFLMSILYLYNFNVLNIKCWTRWRDMLNIVMVNVEHLYKIIGSN